MNYFSLELKIFRVINWSLFVKPPDNLNDEYYYIFRQFDYLLGIND
jgi:hypothetical protein